MANYDSSCPNTFDPGETRKPEDDILLQLLGELNDISIRDKRYLVLFTVLHLILKNEYN